MALLFLTEQRRVAQRLKALLDQRKSALTLADKLTDKFNLGLIPGLGYPISLDGKDIRQGASQSLEDLSFGR